jgi:hypothetical protein
LTEIPSARYFVSGSTGSGKTHALRRLVLPRLQRVVLVDFVGEWERRRRELPGRVVVTTSLDETRAALRKVAGLGRWSVVAQLAPDEFPTLARWLVPTQFADSSPVFVRAVGGCALLCDELDLIAYHAAPPEVLALWRRGRHVGLTICAATQAPSGVHPLVRGMSRYLVLCQMHEANSIKYFAGVLPPDVVARLQSLPPREVLVFDTHTRRTVHLAADYSEKWSSSAAVEETNS